MSVPLSPQVPVNRQLVGVLSLTCLGLAGLLIFAPVQSTASLWQGALFRVGIVLAAFWLALPSRTREAAWARVPLWNLVGVILAVVVIARTKIPFKLLIPLALLFALAIAILRPRRKARPAQRLFD